ncbi:MAG: lytic transglycosylase domain-containing protein [Flavobacteriales bacterium]|nr:lytic transglycosylase domain-containing protein [Flavobacteriales bacterium]
MNVKRIYLFSALIGMLSAVIVVISFSFITKKNPGPAENDAYREVISEKYRIYSLPLPEKMEFAGEVVPLHQPDIREKLDRELLINTYWHSNSLLSIKRAHRWFPVIEPILAENNIPDDFKYLALIESGFVNVVSPAGATGFWQFIDETGKSYGLEINDQVDERYHVEKSTRAACHYLQDAYDQYGSWTLAAASYNMGIAGPKKQIDRQKQNSYYDLMLNDETSRYVFRILAMKEILNHADQYGFVIRPADLYEPLQFKVVTVDSTISNIADFANSFGVTYKNLKLHNPWLRDNVLKNKDRKSYEIKIPISE